MRPAARRRAGLRLGARAPASAGRRHEERRRMVPARGSIRADPVAARRVEPPRDGDAFAKISVWREAKARGEERIMRQPDQVAFLDRLLTMVRANPRDDGPGLSY